MAINLTLGDSGIFNKAKYAKEKYTTKANEEELNLAEITNSIQGYIDNETRGNSVTKYAHGKCTIPTVDPAETEQINIRFQT